MSQYPERPMRKGRPKSTHSGSKKSRSWSQAPGVVERKVVLEQASLASGLVVIGHMTPGFDSFLKTAPGRGKINVGTRLKAGDRPYTV